MALFAKEEGLTGKEQDMLQTHWGFIKKTLEITNIAKYLIASDFWTSQDWQNLKTKCRSMEERTEEFLFLLIASIFCVCVRKFPGMCCFVLFCSCFILV